MKLYLYFNISLLKLKKIDTFFKAIEDNQELSEHTMKLDEVDEWWNLCTTPKLFNEHVFGLKLFRNLPL